MPYSRALKDPVKREQLPFRFAKYEPDQRKLFEDICSNKTNDQEDDEGNVESDEGQLFMDDINANIYTGAQGSETFFWGKSNWLMIIVTEHLFFRIVN